LNTTRQDPGRPAKLRRLQELKAQEDELNIQLAKNSVCDPAQLKKIEDQTAACLEAGNRWTDNVWALKKYLTKKKGISSKEVTHYGQLTIA
jgi:hypothetical protein